MRPVGDDALSEALDRLYAAPLEGFVAVRRALAAELKSRGETAAAGALAVAPKPARWAWAINQVARSHPEHVRAALEALDTAASVQKGASADELRAAAREYRARVADLVRDVRGVLESAGAQASPAHLRLVGEAIQAAGAEGSEGRAQLLAGRLVKEVEVDDPFAALDSSSRSTPEASPGASATGGRAAAKAAAAKAKKSDDDRRRKEQEQERAAERERLRRQLAWKEARERVAELEEKARDARAAARQAETAAARAEDAARRARRTADEVQARLERAREEERALR
jgi:hypothetical protein